VYWYDRGPATPQALDAAVAEFEKTGDFDGLQYLTKKELYRRTRDTRFLVRSPCFHDSAYMNRLLSIVGAVARSKARFNLDYYLVGDEGSLTSYTDPFNLCWCPYTLGAFREWLKNEYGSLQSLNGEWKTNFAKWIDVVPFTTEQAMETGNFAPWSDHRTFMDITFANAYKSVRDAVISGDPDGHIGVSGTQRISAFNGCDWYRLDQVVDDFIAYAGGSQIDIHRSFAKPEAMIGFWTGYGWRGPSLQTSIWTAAVHNILFPNIFWMYSFLNPDFTYSQSALDMGEVFKTLRFQGVGKLFMESERLGDRIALHHSMSSVQASTITHNHPVRGLPRVSQHYDAKRDFPSNLDGWVRVIKDVGLQSEFVSYDQIEKQQLRLRNYKVFIMPFSMALSVKEADEISQFAKEGGIVIADAMAGVMDKHCAWQPQGLLNSFFGIATDQSHQRTLAGTSTIQRNADGDVLEERKTPGIGGVVTVTPVGRSWGMKPDLLAGIEAVESHVQAVEGQALLKVGDTDALVVRRVGKGWAIYLNMLLDRYIDSRSKSFGGSHYRGLIDAVLSYLEVRPQFRVLSANGSLLDRAQVVRYRLGDREILAIVKEDADAKDLQSQPGISFDPNDPKTARQAIEIRLPSQCHVRDVRTGQQFGYTDTIKTSIRIGDALVLGLAPSPSSLTLSGPAEGNLGDRIRWKVKLSTGGKHLVRCHFFAPDGAFIPAYASSTLVEGSSAEVVLPSALNDSSGLYRIEAADVVSGASAETRIHLH